MRLTLRTLLAYLDDTLPPAETTAIGHKVAESENARELIDRIKKLTRKRGLATPTGNGGDSTSNPNTVAEYLSDALSSDAVTEFESACLDTEINLAEVAACHQILTLLLSEPARVPPTARKRMYELVKGPESLPNRKPGLTVPVGGMPAEKTSPTLGSDDAGALLGLSPASVGLRWAIAFGLMLIAILAAWYAWPESVPQSLPPVVEIVDPTPKEPDPKPKPPEVSTPTTDKPKTDVSNSTPVETAVPATPKPMVPVDPPKKDPFAIDPTRKVVGKVVSKDQVMLASLMGQPWTRVTDNTFVSTGDRIVCLPGYKAKLQLDNNVVVSFWANLPEQIPNGPLESAATFHFPSSSVAADLTLNSGRLYLQTADPAGATIRVRFAGKIVDVKLADEKSEVALQVTKRITKGLALQVDPETKTTWAIATIRGSAQLEMHTANAPVTLKVNEGVDSEDRPSAEIAKSLARQFVYPDAPAAAAAQKALAAFAASLTSDDRVDVKLAEATNAESAALARIGVFGQAATGDVAAVSEALADMNRPSIRDAAAVSLRACLANDSANGTIITKTLIAKTGLDSGQSDWTLSLLRGPDSSDIKSAMILKRLVDGLTAATLPERELCHRTLLLDVDSESIKVPGLYRYDPSGSVESQVACQKLWRKRVEELVK